VALDPAVAKLLAKRQRHLAAGDRLGDSGSSSSLWPKSTLAPLESATTISGMAVRIPDELDAVCDIVVSTVALSNIFVDSLHLCLLVSFVVG
jgi:hypothetical protein